MVSIESKLEIINCCIQLVVLMNVCLLCDIVVDVRDPYALESLVFSPAPKSESSSQRSPQHSLKSLSSYSPNSPLLVPAPAPIQTLDDNLNKYYYLLFGLLLLFMFLFMFALVTGFDEPNQTRTLNTTQRQRRTRRHRHVDTNIIQSNHIYISVTFVS